LFYLQHRRVVAYDVVLETVACNLPCPLTRLRGSYDAQVLNPQNTQTSKIFLSRADYRCPEDGHVLWSIPMRAFVFKLPASRSSVFAASFSSQSSMKVFSYPAFRGPSFSQFPLKLCEEVVALGRRFLRRSRMLGR